MIIANRRTREKREISYSDFRKEFAREIEAAYQSYRRTELSKSFFEHLPDAGLESDFYFSFRWNFNNFGNSAWYIEKD